MVGPRGGSLSYGRGTSVGVESAGYRGLLPSEGGAVYYERGTPVGPDESCSDTASLGCIPGGRGGDKKGLSVSRIFVVGVYTWRSCL